MILDKMCNVDSVMRTCRKCDELRTQHHELDMSEYGESNQSQELESTNDYGVEGRPFPPEESSTTERSYRFAEFSQRLGHTTTA